MSSISGVTSGTEQFLKDNSMDIQNREKQETNQKSKGVTSTDFDSVDSASKDREEQRKPNNQLTFEDMLSLMVTQLQNQTIDNTADTNDMMNQLISMTVMQSLTTLTTAVEEVQTASVMSYAASLVGKEVTLGVYNEQTKKIEEVYGTVEASGTYDGRQVIFVDGKSYFLSDIMAVGKLPPMEDEKPPAVDGEGDEDGDGTDGVEKPDGSGGADGDSDSSTDGTDSDNSVDGTDEAA